MKHAAKKQSISFIAVILTALASGDDFNFAGLVWSYCTCQAPSCSSILDDDDFIESAESQKLLSQPPVACVAKEAELLAPPAIVHVEDALFHSDRLLLDQYSLPLRC